MKSHRSVGWGKLWFALFLAIGAGVLTLGSPANADDRRPIDFGRDVLPILSDRCFLCHGPDEKTRKADLRLDRQADALRTNEPVIVPGRSDESELIARVVSAEPDEVMPPPKHGKALTRTEVETLRTWIDAGAVWGRHWAFEPVAPQQVPSVIDAKWPRDPLDRFILARIEAENLRPSPEAPPETLLRRVSLDLTGLPPSAEEVDRFRRDTAPGSYERLVDRLLASPQYGERMAWDWLDAARYADSNGYQGDNDRTMWPWRDWVVSAFNANLPYDQFTVWQLAGDLLPGSTQEQTLATAFCRNHMINGEGGRIAEENRVDYVMDMTETTATVWLGLTFNCCRCHDHKFDPLTQRDYYGLFALFNQTPVDGSGGDPKGRPFLDVVNPEQAERGTRLARRHEQAASAVDQLERTLFPRALGKPASTSTAVKMAELSPEAIKALDRPVFKRSREQVDALRANATRLSSEYASRLDELRRAIEASDAHLRSIPRVMVMADRPERRETHILARGSYEKPTARVEPSLPASLASSPSGPPRNRLDLARWLTMPDNPIAARVVVNRFWQQVFGVGLVKTSEDFGVQGERPSHPELLDWLAGEFIRSSWDTKALMRRIVTSATYRQSSRVRPELLERDPQNRLLARGARYRLPSWMIRDQALASSGLLVTRLGGPPVRPYQPDGVWEEATFGNKRYQPDKGESLYRRSLYTFWRRIVGPTMFFDASPRQTCIVKPTRTNSPMHALTTLNDVTFVEAARVLAGRAMGSCSTTSEQVAWMMQRVLGRRPSDTELKVLTASHARLRSEFDVDRAGAVKYLTVGVSPRDTRLDPVDHAALAAVGLALLNLDEALTRE